MFSILYLVDGQKFIVQVMPCYIQAALQDIPTYIGFEKILRVSKTTCTLATTTWYPKRGVAC